MLPTPPLCIALIIQGHVEIFWLLSKLPYSERMTSTESRITSQEDTYKRRAYGSNCLDYSQHLA